jgi:hypothetical protein
VLGRQTSGKGQLLFGCQSVFTTVMRAGRRKCLVTQTLVCQGRGGDGGFIKISDDMVPLICAQVQIAQPHLLDRERDVACLPQLERFILIVIGSRERDAGVAGYLASSTHLQHA